MTYPHYQSGGSCGFHSQYYILSTETRVNYCTFVQAFNSCEELIRQLRETVKEKEGKSSDIVAVVKSLDKTSVS